MASLARRRIPPEYRASLTVLPPRPLPRTAPDDGRELWLALDLPQLVLESLQEQRHPPGVPARVVVDLGDHGQVVCACDAAACAAGVRPGMSLNAALALLPVLQTLARDPRRERRLLETVAACGLRYTPRVSLEPPDGVLLEVRGSLGLFGGARRLRDRLRDELVASGLAPRLALAPTPLAALWFARSGAQVLLHRRDTLAAKLAPLPLACTRWPPRELQRLETMGVRTVGDCLRLPRDGFARRFAPRMLRMLDQASGRLPDPRRGFAAAERFAARRELEPEIARSGPLAAAAAPLLDELCAWLRGRRGAVQALELRLLHREAPATRLRLRFVEPVATASRIAEQLSARLERLDLVAPVRALQLRSAPPVESCETSAALFAADHRQSGRGVPQLVERLRSRLGTDAVHGLCLVPEHRPESAWRSIEPRVAPAAAAPAAREPAGGAIPPWRLRPLWLLAEPQPLDGAEGAPCCEGRLVIEDGPERIETGWWDGRDVARDYYVARNPRGARLWVFRERRGDGRWFLHGVFG